MQDRFVKVFDALESHAKHGQLSLTTEQTTNLVDALLVYLKKNPEVIELPYPADNKRFVALKLANLLKTS